MMNNINNVQRKSLDYQTPYQLFTQTYGIDISNKLHLKKLNKDEVNLSYRLLKKQSVQKRKTIGVNFIQ